MHPAAIAEMEAAEDRHWWYAGLQDFLARLVSSPRFGLRSRPTVLDVGCGTGANLRLLARCLDTDYLGGFDLRPECVAAARRKCPSAEVYRSDLRTPELHRPAYDLVTCCDVVSDVGLEAARRGLGEIVRRLSPDGRLVLHVPAGNRLYGRHDRFVGTVQRFERRELQQLIDDLGLTTELLGYRMCWLMPLVVAVRWWNRAAGRATAPRASDLRRFAFVGSAGWRSLLACENALTCRGVRWPFGSSLVAVAGRRPSPSLNAPHTSSTAAGIRSTASAPSV